MPILEQIASVHNAPQLAVEDGEYLARVGREIVYRQRKFARRYPQ